MQISTGSPAGASRPLCPHRNDNELPEIRPAVAVSAGHPHNHAPGSTYTPQSTGNHAPDTQPAPPCAMQPSARCTGPCHPAIPWAGTDTKPVRCNAPAADAGEKQPRLPYPPEDGPFPGPDRDGRPVQFRPHPRYPVATPRTERNLRDPSNRNRRESPSKTSLHGKKTAPPFSGREIGPTFDAVSVTKLPVMRCLQRTALAK